MEVKIRLFQQFPSILGLLGIFTGFTEQRSGYCYTADMKTYSQKIGVILRRHVLLSHFPSLPRRSGKPLIRMTGNPCNAPLWEEENLELENQVSNSDAGECADPSTANAEDKGATSKQKLTLHSTLFCISDFKTEDQTKNRLKYKRNACAAIAAYWVGMYCI